MMWVAEIIRMRHIHINSVKLLQLQGTAEVVLCGPRVGMALGAETRPVGLHQSLRFGLSRSPHKHDVRKWRGGTAVLEDQLHSRVNFVDSWFVHLQGAILDSVSNWSRDEGLACLCFPSQSIFSWIFLNTPWKKKIITKQCGDKKINNLVSGYYKPYLSHVL